MLYVCVVFVLFVVFVYVFFFKQKTAYELRISDGSSDVCSSDLRFVAVSGSTRLAGRRADQERRMSAPGKSDRWVRRRPPARDLRDLLLDLLTRLVCVRHHNIDPRVTRRLWRLPADAEIGRAHV